MIVDVKAKILDYYNNPIKDKDTDITVGDILFAAINGGGAQQDDAKEKLLRFRISMRIVAAIENDGQLSLTSSEAALLMASVAKLYMPLIVGRISEIIDGDEKKAE